MQSDLAIFTFTRLLLSFSLKVNQQEAVVTSSDLDVPVGHAENISVLCVSCTVADTRILSRFSSFLTATNAPSEMATEEPATTADELQPHTRQVQQLPRADTAQIPDDDEVLRNTAKASAVSVTQPNESAVGPIQSDELNHAEMTQETGADDNFATPNTSSEAMVSARSSSEVVIYYDVNSHT